MARARPVQTPVIAKTLFFSFSAAARPRCCVGAALRIRVPGITSRKNASLGDAFAANRMIIEEAIALDKKKLILTDSVVGGFAKQ